jgi:asparagine synthetase B (glutamine-hydrolysing)
VKYVEIVERMTAAKAYYRPGGEGTYAFSSRACLLGHRRLVIFDLSKARCPADDLQQRTMGAVV